MLNKKRLKGFALSTTGGAAIGGTTYLTIGGVGLTALGGGVGITLLPFVGLGAAIGAVGYGVYWLGRRRNSA